MEIHSENVDGVAVFRPEGSIDAVTAPELTGHVDDLIGHGHTRLVADFSAVDYTSSAGLRLLLGAVKKTRSQSGDIRLAGVQTDVMKVLSLSGFTSILQVFGDVDSAVASFA